MDRERLHIAEGLLDGVEVLEVVQDVVGTVGGDVSAGVGNLGEEQVETLDPPPEGGVEARR
jgi:hypothetical protein